MIGIKVKYVELFSLSVEQLFYQNKVCRSYQVEPSMDLLFIPTPECKQIMNRMDLVFRNASKGGFIVFGGISGKNAGGDHLLRFPAKKADKLSFLIVLKNPEVLIFNNVPANFANDRIYYFSNQITDVAASRNNLHLSQNAAGVNGAIDSIKKSGITYQYHNMAVVLPGTAKIKHLLSGSEVPPKSILNQGSESDLVFDLSPLPSGKCQLLIHNLVTEEFYFTGNIPFDQVFGVVELSLSETLPGNYRPIEPDRSLTATRPVYKILFVSRQTFWRYTVHLQTNSPLYLEMKALTPIEKTDFINKLNIVTNDTNITFSRISATDTEFVFVSDNKQALQEKYISSTSVTHDPLSLILRKYIGDIPKESDVKKDLPYPPTSSMDSLNAPIIYSDIFITL